MGGTEAPTRFNCAGAPTLASSTMSLQTSTFSAMRNLQEKDVDNDDVFKELQALRTTSLRAVEEFKNDSSAVPLAVRQDLFLSSEVLDNSRQTERVKSSIFITHSLLFGHSFGPSQEVLGYFIRIGSFCS